MEINGSSTWTHQRCRLPSRRLGSKLTPSDVSWARLLLSLLRTWLQVWAGKAAPLGPRIVVGGESIGAANEPVSRSRRHARVCYPGTSLESAIDDANCRTGMEKQLQVVVCWRTTTWNSNGKIWSLTSDNKIFTEGDGQLAWPPSRGERHGFLAGGCHGIRWLLRLASRLAEKRAEKRCFFTKINFSSTMVVRLTVWRKRAKSRSQPLPSSCNDLGVGWGLRGLHHPLLSLKASRRRSINKLGLRSRNKLLWVS